MDLAIPELSAALGTASFGHADPPVRHTLGACDPVADSREGRCRTLARNLFRSRHPRRPGGAGPRGHGLCVRDRAVRPAQGRGLWPLYARAGPRRAPPRPADNARRTGLGVRRHALAPLASWDAPTRALTLHCLLPPAAYISFYGPAGSRDSSVHDSERCDPCRGLAQDAAADIGASAEPSRCTASADKPDLTSSGRRRARFIAGAVLRSGPACADTDLCRLAC